MTLTFFPLSESHFPLLLKWLKAPHVKTWWDPHIQWTPKLIQEKYTPYVQGCKLENDIQKQVAAFIICNDHVPIGYIQLYNAYDFPRDTPLVDLPKSLAAFDMFIGEQKYLGRGLGSQALQIFLEKYCDGNYEAVFADPGVENIAAIKTYEKIGFEKIRINSETGVIWMIKECSPNLFL